MVLKITMMALALVLSGCEVGETRDAAVPVTKRQADSALGASGLPGARGITGAIDVADSAAARSARIDSAAIQE